MASFAACSAFPEPLVQAFQVSGATVGFSTCFCIKIAASKPYSHLGYSNSSQQAPLSRWVWTSIWAILNERFVSVLHRKWYHAAGHLCTTIATPAGWDTPLRPLTQVRRPELMLRFQHPSGAEGTDSRSGIGFGATKLPEE